MTEIAAFLERKGLVLRSGGSSGADMAFEAGVSNAANKEIYLPWKGFNMSTSPLYGVTPLALEMAAEFHPAWEECSTGARELHARNCYQVLGRGLDDLCKFVVCWTVGGKSIGGTAQAMRVAARYRVPVFNLAKKADYDFVEECMRTEQIFA